MMREEVVVGETFRRYNEDKRRWDRACLGYYRRLTLLDRTCRLQESVQD